MSPMRSTCVLGRPYVPGLQCPVRCPSWSSDVRAYYDGTSEELSLGAVSSNSGTGVSSLPFVSPFRRRGLPCCTGDQSLERSRNAVATRAYRPNRGEVGVTTGDERNLPNPAASRPETDRCHHKQHFVSPTFPKLGCQWKELHPVDR